MGTVLTGTVLIFCTVVGAFCQFTYTNSVKAEERNQPFAGAIGTSQTQVIVEHSLPWHCLPVNLSELPVKLAGTDLLLYNIFP